VVRDRLRGDEGQSGAGILGGIVVAVIVVFILACIIMWPFEQVPQGKVMLTYGGGIIEGQEFQKEVQGPSGNFFNGFADKAYEYPTTQRSYIIARDHGDIQGVISAPTSDRVQMQFEVATYFKLNQSLVRQFHETIGLKYQAWTDEGWDQMLAESFRQQIEYAIQREARSFTVEDFYDQQTLLEINSAVGTALKENVANVLGDEYFCGVEYSEAQPEVCPEFTFVTRTVTAPQAVIDAFAANRTSAIAIETARNNVQVATEEARAIRERQQALESCGQTCVLYEAIKEGGVKFWVIPSDTGLTIPTGPQG
jgi:hypothetical protein